MLTVFISLLVEMMSYRRYGVYEASSLLHSITQIVQETFERWVTSQYPIWE